MKSIISILVCSVLLAASSRADVRLLHHYPLNGNWEDVAGGIPALPTKEGEFIHPPRFVEKAPNDQGKSASFQLKDGKRSGAMIPKLKLPEDEGTVSVWISVRSKQPRGGSGFIFLSPPVSNGLAITIPSDSSGTMSLVGDSDKLFVPQPNALGKWRHLALTWSVEKGEAIFYLDGEPLKQADFTSGPKSEFAVRLGCFDPSDSSGHEDTQFDGLMHDLRIYDGALSEDEINSLYEIPSETPGVGPAASLSPPKAKKSKTTAFAPARIFSDHMVLQREASVPIWGKGKDGSTVQVEFDNQKKTAQVKNGRWEVALDPMPANSVGQTLRLTDGKEELSFQDVVVGDVWLATGQSNMQFRLGGSQAAKEEIPKSANPNLRFFITPFNLTAEAPDLPALWKVSSPQTSHALSAVGYIFGQEIQRASDLPIGIVQCAYGGSRAEAWASPAVMAEGWPAYEKYLQSRPLGFVETHPQIKPSIVYDRMLSRLFPLAVKGTIWYQGEGNSGNPKEYQQLFPAVMAGFRERFRNPEMPFYFVQLARLEKANWAPIRQAQLEVWKKVPHTFMAVTIDLPRDFNKGDNPIHPNVKKPIGERLARAARHHLYGEKDLVPSGPKLAEVTQDNGKTSLRFDYAGEGLQTLDGQELRGLYGGAKGQKLKPLTVTLQKDRILIDHTANGLTALHQIRYGSELDMGLTELDVNLSNSEGLPASPFVRQI